MKNKDEEQKMTMTKMAIANDKAAKYSTCYDSMMIAIVCHYDSECFDDRTENELDVHPPRTAVQVSTQLE